MIFVLNVTSERNAVRSAMIEAENMFEDLRCDKVGCAINALRSRQKWDAEKYKLRDLLFEKLERQNYIKSAGTRSQFCMSGGIGFSYLYLVPSNKKGRFSNYTEKILRLVYYASARHYLEIRFAEVEQGQKGRPFAIFGEGDPRAYLHKAHGEAA